MVIVNLQSHIQGHVHLYKIQPQILRQAFQYLKENGSNIPEEQPVLVPRNCKQIKNLQAKERQLSRLTHHALYNLHEIAYDMGDFVYKNITFLNFIIVRGLRTVFQELDHILSAGTCFLLSCDTTFQLGNFYVSPCILVLPYLKVQ